MEYSRSCQQDLKYSLIDIAGKIKKIPNVAGNVWKIQNPCPEISPVKFRAPYIPYCFAMVLTAGFYCDSWAHNVRTVRVVKYVVVYGQIKAADQKYCHNQRWRRKRKEISFRIRGFGDSLDDFWPRYCRAKVLDLLEDFIATQESSPAKLSLITEEMRLIVPGVPEVFSRV